MSFRDKGSEGNILLSLERLSSTEPLQLQRPDAPPVWPAVLTSYLHSLSLGAAMLTWLEVGKVITGGAEAEGASDAQSQLSFLLAVNGVCELVTSQLVGTLSDKYGRRVVQIAAQLGQVVDYGMAALCLPSLGFMRQFHPQYAVHLLVFSRATAGLLGNYKVSLQSYTADISGAEECPERMAYLGAGMVVGMCSGSMVVMLVEMMKLSFRASFLAATFINASIILLVLVKWKDIAPRKDYTWTQANPFGGLPLLLKSKAMVLYGCLVFLSAFALNMYSSSLDFYTSHFLKMEKSNFVALGTMWALQSFLCLGILQPLLVRWLGEIGTLSLSFASMILFYFLFACLTKDTASWAFVIIILFSLGSMAYPLAVGLATRELPPEQQGALQGAISTLETLAKIVAPLVAAAAIKRTDQPGQFFGLVYMIACCSLLPGLVFCFALSKSTGRTDPRRSIQVEMS